VCHNQATKIKTEGKLLKKPYLLSLPFILCVSCFGMDPFSTEAMVLSEFADVSHCKTLPTNALFDVIDLAKMAMCNNPDAKVAYENALYQAYQVGIATSAYLPNISATASLSSDKSYAPTSQTYNQQALSVTASLLLYDFGGRSSSLEGAKALLAAVQASSNQTLQNLFYSVIQGYYGLFSSQALVQASIDAEKSALESLKAAVARYEAGSGTKSDKLQAQTAYSNATLTRIRAQGDANTASANLSNLVGLEPTSKMSLQKPSTTVSIELDKDIELLTQEAKKQSPQIVALKAAVESARANIAVSEALGMPSISLSSTGAYSDATVAAPARTASVGVYATIPIFSGFSTAYKIKSAKVQLEQKQAELDKATRQVSLDVVTANQNLTTGKEALYTAKDLVASAKSSYELSLGRYKAGVSGILELLNAGSSLANADMQKIKAEYDLALAKVALAKSVGRLGLGDIKSEFGQIK
jgi:outer membrane protein